MRQNLHYFHSKQEPKLTFQATLFISIKYSVQLRSSCGVMESCLSNHETCRRSPEESEIENLSGSFEKKLNYLSEKELLFDLNYRSYNRYV